METQSITFLTPIGNLQITATDNAIKSIDFIDNDSITAESLPSLNPLLNECKKQLKEYFSGERKQFSVPLDPDGTDFQKKVWKALIEIPYGKTASYGDLALKLGDKNLMRAVGGANGRNPIAIIIPCHRIIGTSGTLTGYAGGLWRKKWLLDLENPNKQTLLF
ncbi:MAG: methylated-DNA--[protein]-cysteine S-methyltransferase [Bacteroidia bacterium]